jgi:RimJ/RimL family protein N-acetyltransferase
MFEIPTLTTNRLRLRAFRADDLDAYAAMQADPEVMRYLVTGRTSTRVEVWRTMATSLGQWALRGYGMWACEKIDGDFVGSVGIFQPLDWPEPEIAYSLDRPFWRQGFATEAATAARNWLFGHFPVARAASFIRPDNHPSKTGRGTARRGLRADVRVARIGLRILGASPHRRAPGIVAQ